MFFFFNICNITQKTYKENQIFYENQILLKKMLEIFFVVLSKYKYFLD